jgi:hypothetical protein
VKLYHKPDSGFPTSGTGQTRRQKKFFQSGKKSKNRKRFFDFLPLYKILFAPDGGLEGNDLNYDTASL